MPNLLLPYQELPIVTNLIIAHFQAARASKRWWAQGSWGVAWWCQPPSRAPPPPAWWSPSSTPPPWVVTDTNKFNGKHELQSTKVDSSTNLPSIWSKTCYRKMAHLIDCMSPCVIQYISPTLDFSWLMIASMSSCWMCWIYIVQNTDIARHWENVFSISRFIRTCFLIAHSSPVSSPAQTSSTKKKKSCGISCTLALFASI